MFDAPFPPALLKLWSVLAGMSLGMDMVSPQCAGVKSTFYSKYLMLVASLALVFAGLMLGPLSTMVRKRRTLREMVLSPEGARASRDLFVIVLLIHPSVSGTSMQFFRCRDIEGESYLMADYDQRCYDAKWFAYLPLVSFVLLFFSLGVPLAIARILYLRRDSLYDDDGKVIPQPLDILYAIYQSGAYFYEAVQMVFKLALWSALVFFKHGSEMQLATALVVNVLQLCAHVFFLPMGGDDAMLLNLLQTGTLVLTA